MRNFSGYNKKYPSKGKASNSEQALEKQHQGRDFICRKGKT